MMEVGRATNPKVPSAELAYLTISTVILSRETRKFVAAAGFNNSHEYRKLEDAESLDTVLPGM